MSPAFPVRRRAEQFDALVEGTSTTTSDAASGELLELVATLRSVPATQPRPEFVAALRERLMVAAESELVAGARAATPAIRPKRSSRDRRLATALGGFALVGATASMAVAAQHALPGDELYPMKRAMENAHAQLSVGNDAKGATLLANASGRLAEINELTSGDNADGDVIADTLAAFADQAIEASDLMLDAYAEDGDEAAITELAAFTDSSLATLDQLEPDVPFDARGALADARSTIAAIQAAAYDACLVCAIPELTEASVVAAPDPLEGAVRHPGSIIPPAVQLPTIPTLATASPTPEAEPTTAPVIEPSADPTDAPAPTETPTAVPGPTGLPASSPPTAGEQDPAGGGPEDESPVVKITDGQITVGNPLDPAEAAVAVAEAAAGAIKDVGGVLGRSDRPAADLPVEDGPAQPDLFDD